MILLVDHYDSFTYNLYALFKNQGADLQVVRENSIPGDLKQYKGIILSPGPSHPRTMKGSIRLLEKVTGKIPVFGVCLGMQIIGLTLGGTIRKARSIMHGKKDIAQVINESIILKGVPREFKIVRYHSLIVEPGENLKIVAVSVKDGEVMAVENEKLRVFGVQFHPESVESEYGEVIAKNFLEVCYGSNSKITQR